MRYLSDEMWGKIPTADFRPRFFVETYVEKLSMDTPHFNQSRLMNVFSSCTEALAYIDEYQSNEKNGGYILSALDEIDSCISCDPIAQSLFSQMNGPITQLFKKIRGGDLNHGQLNRLSVICRAILTREEEYSVNLLEALRDLLIGATDISQHDRLTSRIYTLTGLYTTHLLNKGYSPTYLFNRSEMFTREGNYSGRSFRDQFQVVTEKLRSHTMSFDVYFGLRANRPGSILSIKDDPDFQFSEEIPGCIRGPNLEKLKKEFDPNLIAKATIESTDYVTASWQIKDKLDKFLDAVTALELNPKIKVSAHCVTISRNGSLVHTKTLNINLLISFLASEGGTYFSNSDATIHHALAKLDDQGKEHLGRSLRYLRLARESSSLEQKLLNLWIALESLFADGETSILASIVEYVPQIYAVSGLRRRVRNLRDLLVKNQIATTPIIRERVMPGVDEFDLSTTDAHVFLLLRNEKAAMEIFHSLGGKEHLKFKLLSTFREMKGNKAIAGRIKQTEADVTRQLRRIYFLRNKIAHTGHYANIRPQLITHLLDYLAVCYMAISTSATCSIHKGAHTISDLLAAYKMGAEVVVSRSKSTEEAAEMSHLTPVPVI